MRSALSNEVPIAEVIDSDDAQLSASYEVLVIVGNANRNQLVGLASVRTALDDDLRLRLPQVPVRYLALLAHRDELVVVLRGNREAVHSAHSLGLVGNPLLVLQVPTQYRFVSRTGQQVNVIWKYLNLGHFAGVLFQMRH